MIARFAAAAAAVLLWSNVAVAGIIGTTGDVQIVSPPASVVPPSFAEDGVVHLFVEQTDVALASDVLADMTVHYTTYNPPIGRTLGTIPMGTVVSSYYLHFDPATAGPGVGSVTFAEPIVAVIAEGDDFAETAVEDPPGDTLGPSNFLGAGGTAYPDNDDALGIEDGPDRLTLYEATLSFFFGAGSPGDRVRVLTAQTGTPSLCGNGVLDAGEGCDDGNLAGGDGCFGCQPEMCSACSGEPSTCSAITTCTNGDGCCAEGCTPQTDSDCSAACTAKRINCVVKKKSCRLKCYQKAAKTGGPVDTTCLAKCSGKFDTCMLNQDLNAACNGSVDSAAIEAKVDDFVADVAATLDAAPPEDASTCRAKKIKCVDKYDVCVLKLLAKASKSQTEIDPAKRAKCEAKFNGGVKGIAAACFSRLEASGSCETTGDTFDIQNKDDAFIEDVKCDLGLCP